MEVDEMPEFIRLKDVSRITGFSKHSILRWIRQGNGTRHFRAPSGVFMFKREDVDSWLNSLAATDVDERSS